MANDRSGKTKRPRSGLNSGLDLLETLAAADGAMTLTAIAGTLGMSKAGVFEQLSTLTRRGYVARSARSEYSVGMRLWELGCSVPGLALARLAAPHMAALSRRINEGVILGALDGADVVYLHLVESPQAVRVHAKVGDRIPAHTTSTGLALLAAMSDPEVEQLFPRELKGSSPETLRTREAMLVELGRVRARGYAINRGGWRSDVGGIAVAIEDRTGAASAALCVAVPLYRLTKAWIAPTAQALRLAADRIGADLAASSGNETARLAGARRA